jgi:hypothetical protein
MDSFDYNDYSPRQSRTGLIWGILTILTLVCVFCVGGVSLVIFVNPNSALNPFPPPTMPSLAHFPTETPTDVVFILPATWTVTSTSAPSPTQTSIPTDTQQPTPTPITITPSPTITAPPPPGGYSFEIRPGSAKAIPNIYHPELGCNWMGVGGQVVDMSNAPVIGLIIKLGGRLPNVSFHDDMISLTGLASSYGRSGYEFALADHPIASRSRLWVQLLSQSGAPLSEQIYFNTYDSCEQNLIIIDFVQMHK